MCGIVGFCGNSLSMDLLAGLRAIAHRGPDDSGVFEDFEAGIGLAHARLSIIDLSPLGHQPMVDADERVVLVFNGEIYNYLDLRAELEMKGVRFRGHSDTEVLLQMYLAFGMDMLPRLNGIFAFAIYDRHNGDVWIARDAIGVKPLYFVQNEDYFAFSSEIKSLKSLCGLDSDVDYEAIQRYLTFLWCPGEGTPLKKIRKLGPGEALHVRSGKIQQRLNWYKIPQFNIHASDMGEREAIESVKNGLRAAVHRQMVADVPVGAFLSGGLDSSAVVAFARELSPEIRCFTIEATGGVDHGEADDLPYARRVAEHLGVKLDVVTVDAGQMAANLQNMVWQLDEPLADPAPLNVLYICELARKSGIKVLLSGAGGDDLFTGYRRHLAVRCEGLWSWLPRSGRVGLENLARHIDQRNAFGRRINRLFANAGASGDTRLAAYFAWARRADLLPLYSPAMRAAVEDVLAEQPILDFLGAIPEETNRIDRMLALEQRFFLSDHNLIYTDKMSMAVGVEVRVPFLDLELVELAARIPSRFKQRGRIGKWVLKKAMESYLPHDVIYRPKTGFGAPLRRWIRNELRELLLDMLSPNSLKSRGLFDPKAVQQLIADNDQGRMDAAYTLFSLLCIEIWFRRFVDGDNNFNNASESQA
jgi:asparagine synthase (glutamine-hydrolysing)